MTDNQPQHSYITSSSLIWQQFILPASLPMPLINWFLKVREEVGWWHTMWGERILAVTPDSGDCGSPHQKLYPWSNKNKIRNQISAAQVTPADELLMNRWTPCSVVIVVATSAASPCRCLLIGRIIWASPRLIWYRSCSRHPHTAPVSSCHLLVTLSLAVKCLD